MGKSGKNETYVGTPVNALRRRKQAAGESITEKVPLQPLDYYGHGEEDDEEDEKEEEDDDDGKHPRKRR